MQLLANWTEDNAEDNTMRSRGLLEAIRQNLSAVKYSRVLKIFSTPSARTPITTHHAAVPAANRARAPTFPSASQYPASSSASLHGRRPPNDLLLGHMPPNYSNRPYGHYSHTTPSTASPAPPLAMRTYAFEPQPFFDDLVWVMPPRLYGVSVAQPARRFFEIPLTPDHLRRIMSECAVFYYVY